jgi:hypothetical protein
MASSSSNDVPEETPASQVSTADSAKCKPVNGIPLAFLVIMEENSEGLTAWEAWTLLQK